MRIYSHAVAKYVERVLKLEQNQAATPVRQFALDQIERAVNQPEMVYEDQNIEELDEGRQYPVHIRNGCAVPVVREDRVYVPTAFNAGEFIKKFRSHEPEITA